MSIFYNINKLFIFIFHIFINIFFQNHQNNFSDIKNQVFRDYQDERLNSCNTDTIEDMEFSSAFGTNTMFLDVSFS